jgi:hypothetical protein
LNVYSAASVLTCTVSPNAATPAASASRKLRLRWTNTSYSKPLTVSRVISNGAPGPISAVATCSGSRLPSGHSSTTPDPTFPC